MAEPAAESPHDAERMKFFTDAVVAIAMTLLILPLLESVSEAAREGVTTAEFLGANSDALLSFVLSFVIIASFWFGHERLFSYVGSWDLRLLWLNVAWMLTIVFLPVATAMTGSMVTDRLQVVVYIGTMWLNATVLLGMNLVLRASPALWHHEHRPGNGGVAASMALMLLFLLALVLALVLPPGSRYLALLVLFLSGWLQGMIARRLARSG